MDYIIKKIKHILYLKRKQILFALFAILCYLLDNNSPDYLMKSAAPAVVATAAKAASAAKTAKAASDVSKAKKVIDTANQAKKASDTMEGIKKAKDVKDTAQSVSLGKNNYPKNVNPKTNSPSVINRDGISINNSTNSSGLNDSLVKDGGNNKTSSEKKNTLMPSFTPSNSNEEDVDDEESITDSMSVKKFPISPITIMLTSLLVFSMIVPLSILSIINATSSTMSEVDCSIYSGENCKEEESSIFDKLLNLFKYGQYGSNSEVVIKEIDDTYEKIKEEYDFIISIPLLSSSIFSDAEYIKTDVEDGKMVVTEKMLERVEHIHDVAMLQLVPKYIVYSCSYDNGYKASYEYFKSPTYEEDDTIEEDMSLIPTGECDSSTVGGLFKKVTYQFDVEKYFKRYEDSEELDLVYSDFNDADKLLISKVKTQYNMYKIIYDIDEELEYVDLPLELIADETVNLQTPLKGGISITSPYGNREGEFDGVHNGIDLVASNKNIYAAGFGVVTRSNVETEGGNVIEITHTDKFGKQYVSQYAHLSERLVNVGDIVNSGDIIGIMGDTGTMASGVHLHFAMWDKETHEYYNPNKLFSNASNY